MRTFAVTGWLEVIIFLIPLFWFGIVIIRRCIKDARVEILLPAGIIFGITAYIFFLNFFSFIFTPPSSIIVSYLFLVILTFVVSIRTKAPKLDFPKTKELIFWTSNMFLWALFLYVVIGKKVGFGGDVNLYYAIGKTFARGNFPVVSPWQPELGVGYHYGGAIFLGAANWLTSLSFDFLHRFMALVMLHSLIQILIFMFKRHFSPFSLVLYQILPLVFLIMAGIFMIVTPVFPLKMPLINNLYELVIWFSNLPSVHLSFETWGAPVTLGLIVYMLHHYMALSMFIVLLLISLFYTSKTRHFSWAIIATILSVVALTNESVFLPSFFCSVAMIFYKEILYKSQKRILFLGLVFLTLMSLIVIFQGGIISDTLLNKDSQLAPTLIIFPKRQDIKEDFRSYLINQQKSKLFSIQEDWKPLRYYHIGFFWLYAICGLILLVYLLKFRNNPRTILLLGLFIAALASTFAYNFIILRFKVADGNRLMILAYQFLGLFLAFFATEVLEKLWIRRNKMYFVLALTIVLLIIVFSSFQPIAEIIIGNTQGNSLKPKPQSISKVKEWMLINLPKDSRVLSIDGLSPFSSKPTDLMIEAGLLTPTFNSDYRAYTTEVSPDYVDMVYTLNPSLLKKFKISYLLIDTKGFANLPVQRQKEIDNPNYFTLIHEERNESLEKVYLVNEDYIENNEEYNGTFKELDSLIPSDSQVYIDSWRDDPPWNQLRKTVIFSLKDKNIIFDWGPGVYLNVLATINSRTPQLGDKYDYLILFKSTKPGNACGCKTKLVWWGIGSNVYLWKVLN